MDIDTFETLVEVISFECANDSVKYAVFSDMFFKKYKNKAASFLHLDGDHAVTIVTRDRVENGYITAYEMNQDSHSYGDLSGVVHYSFSPGYHIKLDIIVR